MTACPVVHDSFNDALILTGGEVLYSKTTFTGGCGLMDANYNKNLVVGFAAEMPNGDAVVFCF